MKKALIAVLVCTVFTIVAQVPALAEQSITLTLDVPQFGGDSRVTPNQTTQDTPQVTAQQGAGNTSGAGADGLTVGRVGVVAVPKASIYRSRTSSKILATCTEGTPIGIVGELGNWYGVMMVDSSTGWIKKDAVKLLNYDLVATNLGRSSGRNSGGDQIVQAALKYTGVPYVWGGNTWNGLDCSGFVKAVYSNFGINLPRVSRDQANVGSLVAWDDLQAGDRLYFACKGAEVDHTGIYMGNGLFIHASARKKSVTVDSLSDTFYARSLVSARRS